MLESIPVGSIADFATLVVVLVGWGRQRSLLEAVGAGVVALARGRDEVDDDRLAADLEVDDRDVDALLADGGANDR